jgi:two-component sensor histidine kinase/HAMP domain-containing protein
LKKLFFSNLSINKKLPVLIFILLIIIITIFSVNSYVNVYKASVETGYNRVKALGGQFSSIFGLQTRTLATLTAQLTTSKPVLNFLQNPSRKNEDTLRGFVDFNFPYDPLTQTMEVWNNKKQLIYKSTKEFNFNPDISSQLDSASNSPAKYYIGKIMAKGDSVVFPIIISVAQGKNHLGYLVRWRRIYAGKKGAEQLSDLLGRSTKIRIGNRGGSFWTNFEKIIRNPVYDSARTGTFEYTGANGNDVIASLTQVPGTQWVCFIEMPKSVLLQGPANYMQWVIIFGIVLLAVGLLLTWIISRTITGPINNLTKAVSNITADNYQVPLDIKRSDEVGILANTFNDMINRINISQRELQEKIKEISEKNQLLESSLREKDILIREVHHRVKNNLQVISSLLALQANKLNEPDLTEAFKESQNRIRSMALVHEKLYKTSNFAKLEMEEYVNQLIGYLFNSYNINSSKIQTSVEIDNILVNIDTAIVLGLIINETVTNSLKHAFNSNGEGRISITLKKLEDNSYVLIIKDSGTGFPDDFNFEKSDTLGLLLVNTLVDQLEGKVEFDTNHGAEIRILFSVPNTQNLSSQL